MKTLPVGDELFHAERQTNMTKLIAFVNTYDSHQRHTKYSNCLFHSATAPPLLPQWARATTLSRFHSHTQTKHTK